MKFIVIFAFIACLIAGVLSDERCPLACTRNLVPTCGYRVVNGKLEENQFSNECEMRNENECRSGNWEPIACPTPQPGPENLSPVPY